MKWLTLGGSCMVLLEGCFTYHLLGSADTAMPTSGTKVEIRLTSRGAATLANQIGPDVLYLQGDILAVDSTALGLAITASETVRRVRTEWKGERLTVPREDIASVSQRELSVGATALMGGLAGGGLIALTAAFSGASSSSGSTAGGKAGGAQ